MDVDNHDHLILESEHIDEYKIKAPNKLEKLVKRFEEISENEEIDIEYVKNLMASYVSNKSDWKKYAIYDPHKYTRNLVSAGNGKYNLIVLCWGEGQGSGIHDHSNAHCVMKILEGSIKETQYEWPEAIGTPLKMKKETIYRRDDVAYINDSIGLHRVENNSHTDRTATLHFYYPAFDMCRCYDQNTGNPNECQISFWSKDGKRTDLEVPQSAIFENT